MQFRIWPAWGAAVSTGEFAQGKLLTAGGGLNAICIKADGGGLTQPEDGRNNASTDLVLHPGAGPRSQL